MEANSPQREPQRGLFASLGEFVRWLAWISLVTAGITVLVLYFIQTQLDEEIRRHVENKFRAHYTEFHVSVGSARRVEGQGVEIRGLSIAELDAPRETPPLVYIDEMFVRCGSTLADLASGRPQAEQLIVRRARIRAEKQTGGAWNLEALFPMPKFGNHVPPVTITDGAVELVDASLPERAPSRWSFRDINLLIVPLTDATSDAGVAAQPVRVTASRGDARAPVSLAESAGEIAESLAELFLDDAPAGGPSAPTRPPTLRIRGSIGGDHFQRIDVDGQWDPVTSAWSAVGQVVDAVASPDMLQALPGDLAESARALEPLHGVTRLAFQATQVAGEAAPRFAFQGEFHGRIEDARLPQSLNQVRAMYRGDERALEVTEFAARAGATTVEGRGTKFGWSADGPWAVELHAEQLELDRRLRAVLPDESCVIWDRFQPQGLVDVHLQARFDGRLRFPEATLVLRGASFAYEKFPYRLTDAQGRIELRDNVLSFRDLTARAGSAGVTIRGELTDPGPDHTGWVEVATQSAVPIDERLVEALPDKSQQIVRSMNPHGMVTCWGRFERLTPNQPPRSRLEIGLANCSVNYDKFPYPVYKIDGRISVEDDQWSFQDLEGYNDSAFIVCSGGWRLNEMGEGELTLNFNAMDVPLEEELRAALAPEVQSQWNHLHPRGTIDQLKIAVRHTRSEGLVVDITAHKQPPSQNVEGRTITVKPAWLKYQLDNVVGTIHFRGGVLELQNIRASHGETDVRLSGLVDTGAGGWRVRLDQLHVDRLHADHDLSAALPAALGQAVAKLNLAAPLSLDGRLELAGRPGTSAPDHAQWLLAFDVENGRINCGVPVEHIHGGFTLAGTYQQGTFSSHGRVEIDSLMYSGVQWTSVRGPLSINSQRLGFGLKADLPANAGGPQPLFASVFGGTLASSGEVFFGDQARFQLNADLRDADLAAVLRETNARRRDIQVSGRAMGELYLTGTDRGMHSLKGNGRIRLADADIYELPLMIRLLKLLSIKAPDLTAFTAADMEFRIEEDHVYFDRLDFNGDAISLAGRGEMNMQRAINLTFDTSVGRDDDQPLSLLVRPLLKEAGKRLLVLHVGGTLDDPIVRQQPFPELNQTIQQVFPPQPGAAEGRGTRAAGMFDRFVPRR